MKDINKYKFYQICHSALAELLGSDFIIEKYEYTEDRDYRFFHIDFTAVNEISGKIRLRIQRNGLDFRWFVDIDFYPHKEGDIDLFSILQSVFKSKREKLAKELSFLDGILENK